MRCWRCSQRDERDDLGLCRDCLDWMHSDETLAPGSMLLPPMNPIPDSMPAIPRLWPRG